LIGISKRQISSHPLSARPVEGGKNEVVACKKDCTGKLFRETFPCVWNLNGSTICARSSESIELWAAIPPNLKYDSLLIEMEADNADRCS
jgi:hypothetical protein